MLKTTKAKIAFGIIVATVWLWAIPACLYALYLVATGKGKVEVTA